MSHFYGWFQGSGQEITRTGTRNGGMRARLNGYEIGGAIKIEEVEIEGKLQDVITVIIDGGSGVTTGYHAVGKFLRFTRDEFGDLVELAYNA